MKTKKPIIVLKFGGSSVSDNIKLNIVAEKIIDFYNKRNQIVVVVSAQGDTTDKLIKEAKELSNIPDDRELDVLLSTGEQISMSKLAILLNRLGYKSISLTGIQAGIFTSQLNQNAKIENIDISRIEKELSQNKIVIVAGFQGVNEKGDITTLGRGGSDSTAVALASKLNAKHCYIFSDVDGVYTSDPNKITIAKKLDTLSYEEMLEISNEGAKVLHNRCVEIAQKYNLPIIAKSTFNNISGTIIQDKIEDSNIKSIVKNDDILYVNIKYNSYSSNTINKIFNTLLNNKIRIIHLQNNSKINTNINFIFKNSELNKFQTLLENELRLFETTYYNVSRIAIVGHGIMNNENILEKIMNIIDLNKLEIYHLEISESKIAIVFSKIIANDILEKLHEKLIHNK